MKLSLLCWWWRHNFAGMCGFGDINPSFHAEGGHVVADCPQNPCDCSLVYSPTMREQPIRFHMRASHRSDVLFFHYIEILEFTLDDSWILLKMQSLLPLRLFFNMHISQLWQMHSVTDSCNETSGWHVPGLGNVRETALSIAAQTSPIEQGGNLATTSTAGLNILRCHKVLPHNVACNTEPCQEREFPPAWSIGDCPIKAAVHYPSLTSCLSRKDPDTACMKHLQPKRLQRSGLDSWFQPQPH